MGTRGVISLPLSKGAIHHRDKPSGEDAEDSNDPAEAPNFMIYSPKLGLESPYFSKSEYSNRKN
jgi:hypothetical protein